MGYRIEYRQPLGLPFYAEFCFVSKGARVPVRIGATTHTFTIGPAAPCGALDYGWPFFASPLITATKGNGMMQTFDPGVVVVTIPAAQLPPLLPPAGALFGPVGGITVPFRLLATKADALASVLAQGTITFGDQ